MSFNCLHSCTFTSPRKYASTREYIVRNGEKVYNNFYIMYKQCIECGDRKYYAQGNKWVDISEKDIMDKVTKFNSEYVLQ
jgi:hypothetical protein